MSAAIQIRPPLDQPELFTFHLDYPSRYNSFICCVEIHVMYDTTNARPLMGK